MKVRILHSLRDVYNGRMSHERRVDKSTFELLGRTRCDAPPPSRPYFFALRPVVFLLAAAVGVGPSFATRLVELLVVLPLIERGRGFRR
jgi:hypothetical protein